MRLNWISLIGALIALVFIVAPTPALSYPDPAETLFDMFDSGKAPPEGGGTVAFEGCKRSEDDKSCSKGGCPKGYECLAAPDGKCTCIKPCGKIGDACGGGCPPGKVCVLSGSESESESECKCEDPTLTCKPIDFPTPEEPQGKACGGECPPGLVCAGDPSKKGGCKCEAMDAKGTCKLAEQGEYKFCVGICPSGKGKCQRAQDEDGNDLDRCECVENCGQRVAENECPFGECLFGAVCRYDNVEDKCKCNPIRPTPTPTPGGDGGDVCCIKVGDAPNCQMTDGPNGEEIPATEIDNEDYSSGFFKCKPKTQNSTCPAGKKCNFQQLSDRSGYKCSCG